MIMAASLTAAAAAASAARGARQALAGVSVGSLTRCSGGHGPGLRVARAVGGQFPSYSTLISSAAPTVRDARHSISGSLSGGWDNTAVVRQASDITTSATARAFIRRIAKLDLEGAIQALGGQSAAFIAGLVPLAVADSTLTLQGKAAVLDAVLLYSLNQGWSDTATAAWEHGHMLGHPPSAGAVEQWMRWLADRSKHGELLAVLEQSTRRGLSVTPGMATLMFRACTAETHIEFARRLWKQVYPRADDSNRLALCHSYLSLLSKFHRRHSCLRVLETMRLNGHPPDELAYCFAIRACAVGSDVNFGVSIYDEMLQAGVKPTHLVFRTLLTACAQVGAGSTAEEVMELFYNAQAEDSTLVPHVAMYRSLLTCAAADGHTEAANQWIAELSKMETPTTNDYVNQALSYCTAGDLKGLVRYVLDPLHRAGQHLSAEMFLKCVTQAVKHEQLPTALGLLSVAASQEVQLTPAVYSTAMRACTTEAWLQAAGRCIADLAGYRIAIPLAAAEELMRAALDAQAPIPLALQLLVDCSRAPGFWVSVRPFHVLLEHAAIMPQAHVQLVLDSMESLGVPPTDETRKIIQQSFNPHGQDLSDADGSASESDDEIAEKETKLAQETSDKPAKPKAKARGGK